ncbi:hypothetical protein [Acinetobacter sp. TUM15071]|uniref:hypothetical protein n=1 Tax=Acinetobacter sp. TUM15071 TaxID=2609135 RepID=UPI00124ED756|nr:hypothetical protein [Acinetobacter sp. TUM15071]
MTISSGEIMIKNMLYCSVMVSSLYFVMGCSESKNTQAVGAQTAQAEAEEAVASAEDVVGVLADASTKADEGAAIESGDSNIASDEGYTDEGSVNPIKQLLEGEPVEVSYSPNQFMTQMYERPVYDIVIQAKTDQVTVNDIIINRGNNCHITKYDRDKKLPANLSFGRMIKLSIGCEPNYVREVEVKTNYGNYKFGSIRN